MTSSIRPGTRSCCGATKVAPTGLRALLPIHTGWVRQSPGVWFVPSMSTRCISRTESGVSSSASVSADCIARVFPTISVAFRLLVSPISAVRMARALAVRCSIWEDAAASERSSSGT